MGWPAIAALGAGVIGWLGQRSTNAANAREARRNREFQERMSSTAHEREVADLMRAGVNPMFRGMGGASSPAGDRAEMQDAVGKGVSTSMQARLLMAQLQKTKAETGFIEDQAMKTRAEVGRFTEEANAGRYERLVSERELAGLSVIERRQMIRLALRRAQAEIDQLMSSAEAARARAFLDRAAATGALNAQEFERQVGEMGPRVRFFMEILRSLRGTIQ